MPSIGYVLRGVITDWGGVLTGPLLDMVRAWIAADDIDFDSYVAVMRPWVSEAYQDGAVNPVHALERGECSDAEFERLLAARLLHRDGSAVTAEGLLDRMFAPAVLCDPMVELLRELRAAGVRTALLSNSWGVAAYPSQLFPELFDAVVISAEVGMRKPEERIFRHAAELLGLAPEECVFVDDIEANVLAAQALGMTGVWHTDPAETVIRLGELVGLPARDALP